jgi:hypothetical protein
MKKSILVAAAVLVGSLSAVPGDVANGQMEGSNYKSFQLVYHSDTRGYYRPCG